MRGHHNGRGARGGVDSCGGAVGGAWIIGGVDAVKMPQEVQSSIVGVEIERAFAIISDEIG